MKTLITGLLVFIASVAISAQEQPELQSRVYFEGLVQFYPNLVAHPMPVYVPEPSKKIRRQFMIDLPLYPMTRKGISVQRISPFP
ncbi:hypothetical protein KW791_03445, partial [Candidatus Parcubacteria bacterium]|nr:hypothetical protein [Candidatus Parcubacteria bacterium]